MRMHDDQPFREDASVAAFTAQGAAVVGTRVALEAVAGRIAGRKVGDGER
jgi:hypothetical protein